MWDTLWDGKGRAFGDCTELTIGCYRKEAKVGKGMDLGDLGSNKCGNIECSIEGQKGQMHVYSLLVSTVV